jgi:hypothetical protein
LERCESGGEIAYSLFVILFCQLQIDAKFIQLYLRRPEAIVAEASVKRDRPEEHEKLFRWRVGGGPPTTKVLIDMVRQCGGDVRARPRMRR